ncbi:unnamed protein product [Adineta steineri]|uniref:Uncharacterized protein n=1 Tax=Adineta steineri TaxID=433720 RepID=A0A814YVG3_9BILA|nr:unnamed protein product [Adineta steineri]
MFILTTSSSSSVSNNFKRRLSRNILSKTLNFTDGDVINLPTNEIGSDRYNIFTDITTLTKTQLKVIITVVIIISFILLIIVIFRFKNACRNQEPDNIQTEIIRNRVAQYSEPSSRRGSVGYYTQKYVRTPSNRFDEQLNTSLPAKRLSIPACDHSSKSAAVVVLSSSSIDTTLKTDVLHHRDVTSSCDTSTIPNQQISHSSNLSIDIEPITHKPDSAIGISQVTRNHSRQHSNRNKRTKTTLNRTITDENNGVESLQRFEVAPRTDDTVLTTPVVHSGGCSRGNNANHSYEQHQHFETSFRNKNIDEKYEESLGIKTETKPTSSEIVESVLLPSLLSSTNEVTRSNEDDLCDDQTPLLTTELVSTIKNSSNHTARKYSLNALLPLVRPSSSHPLCSSLTSTSAVGDSNNGNGIDLKTRRRASLASTLHRNSIAKQSHIFFPTNNSTTLNKKVSPPPPTSSHPIDSDSSDRTSFLKNQLNSLKNHHRKKSSNIIPTGTTPSSSYQKAFMQKIERFRFIDDSASSTTTVTSPVESIERVNNHQACSHLITNNIEQYNDYMQTKHLNNTDDDDDMNSLIDRLNADILTNGSYSDLNILNNTSPSSHTILCSKTFKPVNGKSLQPITNLLRSQQKEYHQSPPITIPHSNTALPLSKQRNQIDTNGHSRSMEFHSIAHKRDLTRPTTLISTTNETSSSSSTTTLTSIRSLTSLEFDDNTKPSGVLVDDDFLPMSSPIDEHFWDMTVKKTFTYKQNECFPNVGSSPDVEIKRFNLQYLNTLSETSCDEDDEDLSILSLNQPEKFSLREFQIKQLQKPLVTTKSISSVQKQQAEEIISDKSSSTPSINSTEQFSINSNMNSTSLDQTTDESLSLKCPVPSQTAIRSDFFCDTIQTSNQQSQIVSEEDDTQESSTNDVSEGDDSADNGEIDLVQEFELSQREEQTKTNTLWTTDDRNVFIMQEDDLISDFVATPTIINRIQPTSIMKITNNKIMDSVDEQQPPLPPPPQQQHTSTILKPKVRFNLDPQYEREREWNKVNKLLGNSVEWTDEFEV